MHYLLVDGYNVIHAVPVLQAAAVDSLDAARKMLCDALCEFRALTRYRIIVVFDAHMVAGGVGSVETMRGIKIVFTKEAETADHYIERQAGLATNAGRLSACHENDSKPDTAVREKKRDRVTVATSDSLEQIIVMGRGAERISAKDLWEEIQTTRREALTRYHKLRPLKKNPIESFLDAETAEKFEEMRKGGRK